MSIPATVACLCGQVELALGAAPQARANCHCASCRDFYATPMLAASARAAADAFVLRRAGARGGRHPAQIPAGLGRPAAGRVAGAAAGG